MNITAIRVNKKEQPSLTAKDGRIVGETEKKQDRITLLDANIRTAIDRGQWDRGLCVRRFRENLTVEGLPALQQGDRITAGTIEMAVDAVGKTCFPACAFQQEHIACPLAEAAVFAHIRTDGRVHTGESIRIG